MKQHITLSIESEVLDQARIKIGRGNMSKIIQEFLIKTLDMKKVETLEDTETELMILESKIMAIKNKYNILKKAEDKRKAKEKDLESRKILKKKYEELLDKGEEIPDMFIRMHKNGDFDDID